MVYRVDVLKEPLNHSPVLMSFGPVLAIEDAVALKVGALHDRALPRDMIDVHAAAGLFSEGDLVAMDVPPWMTSSVWIPCVSSLNTC
jgi:hypothetical protein